MGTLRPPYQQKYFFRPIGAFFFTQTQSDQNPHTKWALFSTLRFTFLSACDSLFDSEGIFERPGPQGLGKYGHCQIGYHRKKIDIFHPAF